ncbi:DUF3955 domain-containing protein [Acetoanaerobium noterae]|uniref:DUF3955 domain-containing protein n=1 Tax=Acetoanaerobium noterae TaxID=745369 RepID=UPI0028B0DECD|nr:DUF3955 domain-containing protein [Acetoanaerobium noterae]
MTISCEIIRDLLPLYHDHICSQASSELVEKHLSSCEKCGEELKSYDQQTPYIPDLENSKTIKRISARLKKDKKRSFFSGMLIVSLIGFISCNIAYNSIGSYVAADGTLVEPFGLIPIGWIFALLSLLSGILLGVFTRIRKK